MVLSAWYSNFVLFVKSLCALCGKKNKIYEFQKF